MNHQLFKILAIVAAFVFTFSIPSALANNPPYPVTLTSPNTGWSIMTSLPAGSYNFSWESNGDPEDDPLWFYFYLIYWDTSSGTGNWVTVAKRYTKTATFTTENLTINGYYAWTVAAVDTTKSSSPWHKWPDPPNDWARFTIGTPLTPSPAATISSDFRHMFLILGRSGLSDTDEIQNTLKFARAVGYGLVSGTYSTMIGMRTDPKANGLKFCVGGQTKSSALPDSSIDLTKTYTAAEIAEYERYCSWGKNLPWPDNMASGWWNEPGVRFQCTPDFQQQKVITETINTIIDNIESIKNTANNFLPGCIQWDEIRITGYFNKPDNTQTTINFWTGTPSTLLHPGITHEFSTYEDGQAAFFKQLFARARLAYPGIKMYAEPFKIWEQWFAKVVKRSDKNELKFDMLTQEKDGTEFVDDTRIFDTGLITKEYVGSTQNRAAGESSRRLIAAKAAINGAWTDWFLRFGGSGDMPDYQSIDLVPARMLLDHLVANWDNLANVPLSSRSWNGAVYQSPNSYMSANIYYSRHPFSKKIFAVFLNTSGVITLKSGETVKSIKKGDGLFQEARDGSADLTVSGNNITLNSSINVGKLYIITP